MKKVMRIVVVDRATGTLASLGTSIKVEIDNQLDTRVRVDAELEHQGQLPDGNLRGPFVMKVVVKPEPEEETTFEDLAHGRPSADDEEDLDPRGDTEEEMT